MKTTTSAACRTAVMVATCAFSCPVDGLAQSLPSPWSARDIGSPALDGSTSFSNGAFRIEAAGTDIGGAADQFHYVYQPVAGDVDVRARVDSVSMVHAWSKAGVMIRASLAADAAHVSVFVSTRGGTIFQRRMMSGGLTIQSPARPSHGSPLSTPRRGPVSRGRPASSGPGTRPDGPSTAAPSWVRLVRVGSRLTAYSSTDGASWTMIATETVTLETTAYIGLAVTSHDPDVRTTANLLNVSVASAALPPGQLGADIGAPAITGHVTFGEGQYAISAGGADIWDPADEFHYVYQAIRGDVDVSMRVVSICAADPSSKAGVMIRESLSADSRYAMSLVSANTRYGYRRRQDPDLPSEETDAGVGAIPGWVRLVRSGSVVTAYRSADGNDWALIGTDSIVMSETVYVGIAVTSHNPEVATLAIVDSLQVKEATAPANRLPMVTLTSPQDGAAFGPSTTLTATASASDADGRIVNVEFFANTTSLGRDDTPPYSVTAGGPAAGTYQIRAVAIDDLGGSTMSSTATIMVAGTTTPRWVVFEASSNHATAVSTYVLRVYKSGTIPSSSSPIATSDLGRPSVGANGEITVDRAAFFEGLAPGSYISTVTAVGSAGSATSGIAAFIR
jgi:regulation of enolase protein 1 (concanavalin A-like superfamily)